MTQYRVAISSANRVKLFSAEDLATSLTKTVNQKPVKIKGATTYVVNKAYHARTIVLGNGCGSECRPEFPAFIEIRLSAPAGTDLGKLKSLLAAAIEQDDFFVASPVLRSADLAVE